MRPRYGARLGDDEVDRLRDLLGRSLRAVATDGWAVEMRLDEETIRFEPETVNTPDTERPLACVARLKVVDFPTVVSGPRMTDVAAGLGRVASVAVHATVVTFSAVEELDSLVLAGSADALAGIGYRARFHRPHDFDASGESSAVVDLDVAVELTTDLGRRLITYTDGTGPFLSLRVDGKGSPGWEGRPEPISRVQRRQIREAPGAD